MISPLTIHRQLLLPSPPCAFRVTTTATHFAGTTPSLAEFTLSPPPQSTLPHTTYIRFHHHATPRRRSAMTSKRVPSTSRPTSTKSLWRSRSCGPSRRARHTSHARATSSHRLRTFSRFSRSCAWFSNDVASERDSSACTQPLLCVCLLARSALTQTRARARTHTLTRCFYLRIMPLRCVTTLVF